MKKLLLPFFICALASCLAAQGIGGNGGVGGNGGFGRGTGAAPAGFVQFAVASCFTTTCTTGNFSVGTLTNGNYLVSLFSGVNTVNLSVAGCGATWTVNGTQGALNSRVQFVATAPITSTATCTGASRPTVTSSTSGELTLQVYEVTSTTGTIDGVPLYSTTNTTTNFTGPTYTTTNAGDIVLTYSESQGSAAYTLNSPYTTAGASNVGGIGFYMVGGYDVPGVTGNTTPGYTWSGTSSTFMTEAVAIQP